MPTEPAALLLRHIRKLAAPLVEAISDRELLRRFAERRDEDAFAVLLRRHGPMVLRVCRRVLPDGADAEDAFQATFLTLARKAATVRWHDSAAGWLYASAGNAARKVRDAAARRSSYERRAPVRVSADPLAEMSVREMLTALDEELSRLPEKYREPLVLCYLEGTAREDAAQRLGCPLGTLKCRLERGKERLRAALERRGLSLTAALAAALVGRGTADAAVPELLARTTLRAAILTTPAAVGLTLSKLAVAFMLTVGLASVGVVAAYRLSATDQQLAVSGLPADEPKAESRQPKADALGDALPEGAVARMGSLRFRHAGLSDFIFLDGGKTILTSGSDRVLRFWDVANGKQKRTVELQGQAGPGRAVTLSPDGKTLAAHDGGNIVLWEVESGKEIKTLPGPKMGLGYLYFSPDGKTLAVGRNDYHVSLWEWQTGKERSFPLPIVSAILQGMDSTFHGSFSPDGKRFVAGARAAEPLGVFEVATGREVNRLTCYARTSTVSPDSKRLAICGWKSDKGGEEVVRLIDLASGKEIAQFPVGDEDSHFHLAFSPDGKTLACGFSDHSCILDCTTGRVLHRLSGRPIGVEFSPDGKTLVASTGHRLRFWDASTGKEFHDYPGEFGYDPVLAVSPNGRFLAAGDWMEQEVSLWDAASGRLVRRLPLKEDDKRYVRDLAFSADGRALVACQHMGTVPMWDVATGKELRTAQLRDPNHPDKDYVYFYRFHVSPDTKHVATLERIMRPAESTRLGLWETTTGKLRHQHSFPGEMRNAAWSPDGATAALPLADGLTLMDVRSGAVCFRAPGTVERGPIAASPDGRLLAAPLANSKTGDVGVWETTTGKEVGMIAAGRVDHLALAADNRALVTTDAQSLHVWDLADGKERLRWPLPLKGVDSWGKTCVFALVLSGDGRRAFTAMADGSCLVWDVTPARPAEVAAPDEKTLAGWWADLAAEDARRAYAAVWRLAETPGPAVALLRRQLKPAEDSDVKKVRRLIEDLDSDVFDVREKAFKELKELGESAAPALHQTLEGQPSAEVRRRLQTLLSRAPGLVTAPETLRRLRAISVLEHIGSADARRALETLASGAPHAPETREAKATLERLTRR